MEDDITTLCRDVHKQYTDIRVYAINAHRISHEHMEKAKFAQKTVKWTVFPATLMFFGVTAATLLKKEVIAKRCFNTLGALGLYAGGVHFYVQHHDYTQRQYFEQYGELNRISNDLAKCFEKTDANYISETYCQSAAAIAQMKMLPGVNAGMECHP